MSALRIVRTGDLDENAALVARRWSEARTLYQEHACWHEAGRFDSRGFEGMVKLFNALRRGEYVEGMQRVA